MPMLYSIALSMVGLLVVTCTEEHDLKKITPTTIHTEYAVEAVRSTPFALEPSECVNKFRELGYTMVPAPDADKDHPQLFYVRAPYTIGVLQSDEVVKSVHPFISVVVHKNAASIGYRSPEAISVPHQKKLEFCNSWNFRFRLSTCVVDKEEKYNLQNEIQFVNDQAMNRAILQEGIHYFEQGLKLFGKRLVEHPHPSKAKDL